MTRRGLPLTDAERRARDERFADVLRWLEGERRKRRLRSTTIVEPYRTIAEETAQHVERVLGGGR